MHPLPISSLPTPPRVIDSPKIFTRVTCFKADDSILQVFNYRGNLGLKIISRRVPRDTFSFQVQTVTQTVTFISGKPTGDPKEELSPLSKKHFMTDKFDE